MILVIVVYIASFLACFVAMDHALGVLYVFHFFLSLYNTGNSIQYVAWIILLVIR